MLYRKGDVLTIVAHVEYDQIAGETDVWLKLPGKTHAQTYDGFALPPPSMYALAFGDRVQFAFDDQREAGWKGRVLAVDGGQVWVKYEQLFKNQASNVYPVASLARVDEDEPETENVPEQEPAKATGMDEPPAAGYPPEDAAKIAAEQQKAGPSKERPAKGGTGGDGTSGDIEEIEF